MCFQNNTDKHEAVFRAADFWQRRDFTALAYGRRGSCTRGRGRGGGDTGRCEYFFSLQSCNVWCKV